MTQITEQRLSEFKVLYKKYFGVELNTKEAQSLSRELVNFVKAGILLLNDNKAGKK